MWPSFYDWKYNVIKNDKGSLWSLAIIGMSRSVKSSPKYYTCTFTKRWYWTYRKYTRYLETNIPARLCLPTHWKKSKKWLKTQMFLMKLIRTQNCTTIVILSIAKSMFTVSLRSSYTYVHLGLLWGVQNPTGMRSLCRPYIVLSYILASIIIVV